MTKNNKIYENPFSKFYLAEQFVRDTENIIQKKLLSPEIFNISELISLIKEPMNHFVLGVPGSGKTMVLAFLRVECIAYINNQIQVKKEFKKVWPNIGKGLWGIYHGLLLNDYFLSPENFNGFGLDDLTWTNIFCDFINVIYLRRMLVHLDLASTEPDHHIAKWLGFKTKNIERAINNFSKNISLPPDCNTLKELLKWTKKRLRGYQQLIKERAKPIIEMDELPTSNFFREIGYLPLKLISELKKYEVIDQDQKIFFILDEYDQCVLADRREFAKAINSFVKTTARGNLQNVFIKIGSRPNGFYNKNVFGSDALIEDGRDYQRIDLMMLLRTQKKVFSSLIQDIGNRRIQCTKWFQEKNINSIKYLLDNISEIDEAEQYRKYKSDQDSHFRILRTYCKVTQKKQIYDEIVGLISSLVTKALHQKFLIIVACRALSKLKNIDENEFLLKYEDLKNSLKSIGNFLNSGGNLKDDSKIYYKIKDLKEPALFILASDFKQPKYYCGFETIKLMSEGVPLNFIKLCRAIFDELRYKESEFEKDNKVNIIWQNRAIRKVASEIRKEASSYLCKGQSFLILLDELGFIFRRLQLIPTAPYPTPNGFSIAKETEWLAKAGISCSLPEKNDPLSRLTEILREAKDWGYLIEMPHRSREKSLKTRTKYYISSMLAPYYDLSVRHRKEPYYCEIEDIVDLCSSDDDIRSNKRKDLLNKVKPLRIFKENKPNNKLILQGEKLK